MCFGIYTYNVHDTSEHFFNNRQKIYPLNVVKVTTQNDQKYGLMNRHLKLANNQGMLFYYNNNIKHCVWMKNTYIPLDVIFLDTNYNIVDYKENLIPHDITTICSSIPTQHFLEVNGGFVAKNKLSIGDKFKFNIIDKLN
jgi:uncharacterized membrane protein (UPF0127 family)